jgi:hypothetical protein
MAALLVVAVSALTGTRAWAADQLVAPPGARIGIIVMMPADVTHYHVGKAQQASFMRTYRMSWPSSEIVDDPIALMLKNMGFEPIFLDPTEQLRRQRQSWIIANPLANKLPKAASEEIQRILEAEKLQGLVLVAPGPNANPEAVQGNRLRRLPSYIQGWGFSTSDEPNGVTRPVVFNLTQMLVIGRTAEEPELIFREWGGAFVYEWPTFDPGADLKALTDVEVVKFRPVIQDILQRQITRITPRLKVEG